jgi:hypothetical protein
VVDIENIYADEAETNSTSGWGKQLAGRRRRRPDGVFQIVYKENEVKSGELNIQNS